MSKRLVVCCDGTWNTADQKKDDGPAPTNVVRVAKAVTPRDAEGVEQRVFYHPGVGTKPGERMSGGMFGFGLSQDVRDVYRFLVRTFEPGDELFFFGFSRGAFTARSTVGFIHNCGLLRREHADRIDEAYELYRNRRDRTKPKNTEAQLFRRSYSHEPRIRFIGVWDTVGALGIPLSGLRLVNLINRRWQFHDTKLSSSVDAAFQALAIDERRGPFRPAMWTPPKRAGTPRVEQVWFAGVHSDIGGGYPKDECALADITLLWMVDRAHSCGLAFDTTALDAPSAPDPLGQLHTSRKGVYRLVPAFNRSIGTTDPEHEWAASTAVKRYEQTAAYQPADLVTYLGKGGHPWKSDHQAAARQCRSSTVMR
ncbi:MAG: DUF2235 domain-containing protein [Sciscionella sp.]